MTSADNTVPDQFDGIDFDELNESLKAPVAAKAVLNEEQSAASQAMVDFVASPDPFFVLKGYAGTGKTFTVNATTAAMKGKFAYTAPTNKATKVLRDGFTARGERQLTRTIYSLLGIQLMANGEVKELAKPEDPVDLTEFKAVFVDEGSMVSHQLMRFIRETNQLCGTKFIFMGDDAQLPPVGERASEIWGIERGASLTKVMRHDNQILELVTRIRNVVDHPAPSVVLLSNNAEGEGVFKESREDWLARITTQARAGAFSKPNQTKAIAWRNKVVDELNARIRAVLFDEAQSVKWLPGDRVVMTAPARDLEGDKMLASTDDEGRVERADIVNHPIHREFRCWRLNIAMDDNQLVTVHLLHPDEQYRFARKKEELAAIARVDKKQWKTFWAFQEQFHEARHAYAITSHRAQGSTYQEAFVDYRDILTNPTRSEAFRCLYVACSRPKHALYLA